MTDEEIWIKAYAAALIGLTQRRDDLLSGCAAELADDALAAFRDRFRVEVE